MHNVILANADKAVSIFNIILYHFSCWITNLPLSCVSSTIHKTLCLRINFHHLIEISQLGFSYCYHVHASPFCYHMVHNRYPLAITKWAFLNPHNHKISSPKRAAAPRMITSILQQLSLLKTIYLSLSFSKKSLIGCFFLVVVVLAVGFPFIASSNA